MSRAAVPLLAAEIAEMNPPAWTAAFNARGPASLDTKNLFSRDGTAGPHTQRSRAEPAGTMGRPSPRGASVKTAGLPWSDPPLAPRSL